MKLSETRRLKQALSQEAAKVAGSLDSALWLDPQEWMTYMGKQTRGKLYASFSNEELLSILREVAGRLGHNPSKKEVFCVYRVFLIERFGNWPKALIAAGLKAPRKERRAANRRRELEAMKRKAEWERAKQLEGARSSGQER